MNALALSRYRDKNPSAKTVNEARKIKSKVDNSNRKQRSNMTERLDALERKFDADEQRLSAERDARIAGEIDQKATSLMSADPELDYSTATKMALADDERFTRTHIPTPHDEDIAAAVERRMKADPRGYAND